MYAFIEGQVCEKSAGSIVILAGGVGYLLNCSMSTVHAAPETGKTMRCYTWLSVREDAMELFGFINQEEKQMFLSLIGISGVGPRMALALLSALSVADLRLAIITEDEKALARAPGVGKKIAQRIVLELKDKLGQMPGGAAATSGPAMVAAAPSAADGVTQALAALTGLGYTPAEARDALGRIENKNLPADELLRLALRSMAGM
ncbi:MAG: Holliday junction branch migration protein RuvA [Clostridiales bacterium]|nr:Holliday junction branch migration protein RuvA [Clostridiales bacterium]